MIFWIQNDPPRKKKKKKKKLNLANLFLGTAFNVVTLFGNFSNEIWNRDFEIVKTTFTDLTTINDRLQTDATEHIVIKSEQDSER